MVCPLGNRGFRGLRAYKGYKKTIDEKVGVYNSITSLLRFPRFETRFSLFFCMWETKQSMKHFFFKKKNDYFGTIVPRCSKIGIFFLYRLVWHSLWFSTYFWNSPPFVLERTHNGLAYLSSCELCIIILSSDFHKKRGKTNFALQRFLQAHPLSSCSSWSVQK